MIILIKNNVVKENFINSGVNKADIIDLNNANLDLILDYDVIYVLGGDVSPLIKLNKNSKLKENIVMI